MSSGPGGGTFPLWAGGPTGCAPGEVEVFLCFCVSGVRGRGCLAMGDDDPLLVSIFDSVVGW